jgi:biotin carboxyl carrier protein
MMPVLTSSLDTADETYQDNRRVQLEALADLERQLDLVRAGGGERYARRHHDRGRLLVRERLELLLDRDAPFLELSSLAAWGSQFTVGASILTGISVVSGVECVIIGHDPTVRGGAMNPFTLKKNLRALDIAKANRLPVLYLVESGGADLPTQAELFVDGTEFSSVVLHACTAGLVDLQVDGVRRHVSIYRDGMTRYADSALGASTLIEQPRFPDIGAQAAAGSLTAPMPGTVVRVEAQPGDIVRAGQVLVVLEAMKMEHPVRAPRDGMLTQLQVSAGQSVDQGTVLVVLGSEDGSGE